MTRFKYIAINANGTKVKGFLEAETVQQATYQLHQRNCTPLDIRAQKKTPVSGTLWDQLQKKTVSRFRNAAKFRIAFTQNLSTMLAAGLPMDRALSALEESTELPEQKALVHDIQLKVRGGKDLSQALSSHPQIFNDLYINMVRAGETGGLLAIVLERLGAYLSEMQAVRDKIWSTLIYPLFLFVIGGVSIVILLVFVMPRFAVIFEDVGAAIPLSTQILLSVSKTFRNHWVLCLAATVTMIAMAAKWSRSDKGRRQINRLLLKLPVIKTFIVNLEIARYARTLGELQHNGVELIRAMDLALNTIRNKIIHRKIQFARDHIKEGGQLAPALRESGYFAPIVLQMLTVGEESGRLDEMLTRVADRQDHLVYQQVERMVSILEPLMILGMGVIVGFIVISMLVAIFSVNDISF